jgi:uncharacterized membrane protein YdjX (TVP38/TMEM64 family)
VAPLDPVTRAVPWRLLALGGLVAGGALAVWRLGGLDLATIAAVRPWIERQGEWAPVVFVLGYAVAELFFVPALPLTILGGLAFGPVRGTLYVSIGATAGAALAFLAARYAARGIVEGWIARSPRLRRLDELVARDGWRILMLTRLVPLFPFNVQNFAYGITRIRFVPFVLLTWVCILPATAAFTLAGDALAEGGGAPGRVLLGLAVAGIVIVAVSLIPRWLSARSRAVAELADPR